MARSTIALLLAVAAAAALATPAAAVTCPTAGSSGPIQCYSGYAVPTAAAGAGSCTCSCNRNTYTASGVMTFLASNSTCTVAVCRSQFATQCAAANVDVDPAFSSLSDEFGYTTPVLTSAPAGSICLASSVTCDANAVNSTVCPPLLAGQQLQYFGYSSGSYAVFDCNYQFVDIAGLNASTLACTTSSCNSAAALAATPAAAPATCPVSPSAGNVSCYSGTLFTPPPALAGGGVCLCGCGASAAAATSDTTVNYYFSEPMQVAVSSSASCSAAACTSAFPKCASAAYVRPTFQSFSVLAQPPALVSSGAGSICYTSPFTCTSALISLPGSGCPLGSAGASVVQLGVLTTETGIGSASLQCANSVADVSWGGVCSVCNSNGCNRPPASTLVASPAARPALAALGALAAAAAAALL